MANVKQLKHLEHLEDEMLNYGVEGCKAAVSFLEELKKMLGHQESSGFMQTKWDGAPSVVCGTDPQTGMFFVGTKSVFNKNDPKFCYSEEQIDGWYEGDLAEKLKFSLRYFSTLDIQGVVQGDLLFTSDIRRQKINGEELYTFRPNTITYAIPVTHPIGRAASRAKIGVVFHTHYTGDVIPEMQARAGAKINGSEDVLVVKNDTPMHRVGLSRTEMNTFDRHVSKIESMCRSCGDFLDELVSETGTTGDAKFHIASYLKQFFNAEIKESRRINDPKVALKSLGTFYHEKMNKEVAKMKSVQKQAERRKQLYDGLTYLEENEKEFHAMFALYRKIQENKQIVIDALDNLESFKTFVQTEQGYKVTSPEGYVLHHNGDMIKLVNRIEFSFINFTLAKQWR